MKFKGYSDSALRARLGERFSVVYRIAAGPGNPPVIVEETARIPKAAKDIVDGAGFGNNVLCGAEK